MANGIILAALCVLFPIYLYGQDDTQPTEKTQKPIEEGVKNSAISVGAYMGGGSILGADFEVLAGKRIGAQLGVGIGSFGGGINYHLKEGVNSSFISFQYWHQGFGDNYIASWLGPMFIFRAKKLFQAGIGIGSLLEKGPKWYSLPEKEQKTTATYLINLGFYF